MRDEMVLVSLKLPREWKDGIDYLVNDRRYWANASSLMRDAIRHILVEYRVLDVTTPYDPTHPPRNARRRPKRAR